MPQNKKITLPLRDNKQFKPIQDTPENVARAILSAPPEKQDEWRYLKDRNKND